MSLRCTVSIHRDQSPTKANVTRMSNRSTQASPEVKPPHALDHLRPGLPAHGPGKGGWRLLGALLLSHALLTSAVAAPALAPDGAWPARADFGQTVGVSTDARRVADWVVATRDNGTRDFMLVDKRAARVHVFDNRISYGCINLPVHFYETQVRDRVHRGPGAVVYGLPEALTLQRVFGIPGR